MPLPLAQSSSRRQQRLQRHTKHYFIVIILAATITTLLQCVGVSARGRIAAPATTKSTTTTAISQDKYVLLATAGPANNELNTTGSSYNNSNNTTFTTSYSLNASQNYNRNQIVFQTAQKEQQQQQQRIDGMSTAATTTARTTAATSPHTYVYVAATKATNGDEPPYTAAMSESTPLQYDQNIKATAATRTTNATTATTTTAATAPQSIPSPLLVVNKNNETLHNTTNAVVAAPATQPHRQQQKHQRHHQRQQHLQRQRQQQHASEASAATPLQVTTRGKYALAPQPPQKPTRTLRYWQPYNLKVNEVFEKQHPLTATQIERNRGRILLLGLFELSAQQRQRLDGWIELSAAQMAVQHVNSKGILPGYTLELITNDTQCDPGVGVDRLFHAIHTRYDTRTVMLLGSACSEVTESLAKVVPHWNIVQVSFGSTSPALSDRNAFPNFYRTVAPDSSHNPARIAFIRHFGWDTITTFSQNEEVHSLAVNDLVTELEAANISCAATITFAATDFKEQLLLLREKDTRIIIGSFSQDLAPHVLCEAHHLLMYGTDYAWILHENMGAPWWNDIAATGSGCTAEQLKDTVENVIIVSSHNRIVGDDISYSGLRNDLFLRQLRHKFQQSEFLVNAYADLQKRNQDHNQNQNQNHYKQQPQRDQQAMPIAPNEFSVHIPTHLNTISNYATQTYDAVWVIALAMQAASNSWRNEGIQSKLDQFDYTRQDMTTEFLRQIAKLNFLGVSGPVSFDGPDRVGTTAFYQIQSGTPELIALYHPDGNQLNFHCPHCKAIKWPTGQVPIAKRILVKRVDTIAPLAFYTVVSVSVVGMGLAIAFLLFNVYFRKLKAIKLSSPKLSNITAAGCGCVYVAVILLGLDYATLHEPELTYSRICTARVCLFSAGFSLAFGSMFAKTYRVHRIFTCTGSIFKDKMLRDIQLAMLVGALLVMDALIIVLWVVTDPMERHLHNLTLEYSNTDRSVVYQPQVEVCRSQHTQTWLGSLYVYKGLLLVVGVYMAWETRHVTIPALNDSQYIGLSVYSVVITSAIVVVLANFISERVTLSFITISVLILISTTATLGLLFIPKLRDIWAKDDIIDPIIHSMGLKMECNTRRFVIDDRRELQYRVEVQNRVYKKQVASLDIEIQKLERLLERVNSSATASASSLVAGQHPSVTVTSDTMFNIPPTTGPPFPPNFGPGSSRTPSISGFIPNLLLSVLPPVIPRASWPSAEYMQMTMRRSVAFASQHRLEERSSVAPCLAEQDLYNLRLAHSKATEDTKTGFMCRIRGMFSRTTSSNKGSSGSLTDHRGLKAAFRSHMGLFTRLIPTRQTASCNAIYNGAPPEDGAGGTTSTSRVNLNAMRRKSVARSGTHLERSGTPDLKLRRISTISGDAAEEPTHMGLILPLDEAELERIGVCNLNRGTPVRAVHEPKVNFKLPNSRRPSITPIQPTLRERRLGSPRFPHRVVPTCNLNALAESDDRGGATEEVIALTEHIPLQEIAIVGRKQSTEVTIESQIGQECLEELPEKIEAKEAGDDNVDYVLITMPE